MLRRSPKASLEPHAEALAEGEPRSIGSESRTGRPFEAPPAAVLLRVKAGGFA